MKRYFINAYSDIDILPLLKKVKLKGKIGILTTAQYTNQLKKIQEALPNSIIGGQVIGCEAHSALHIQKDVDHFLFIGSGQFHPIEIALATEKDVYLLNPESQTFDKINQKDIEAYVNRKKGILKKFLTAKKIGVIITIKPGQYHAKQYFTLDKKISMVKKLKALENKEVYYFVCDTLDFNELENYSDIECWVNTACPRLKDDLLGKPVINYSELPSNI